MSDAVENHMGAGDALQRPERSGMLPGCGQPRAVDKVQQRPELLAPAGGSLPFAAALAAGADAIYCGMESFNARRKADNFTDGEFEAACRAAHLAGSRVYVTVNIAIKDEEMPEALELVRRCACLGADAFIVQDWGLFSEIRRLMPQVETHISTQANIADRRGAGWCRDAGADRVTLARELSLDEIREVSEAGIELEVFAHGSICFCYSGLCMLSVFTGGGEGGAGGGRSANRGMCAQPCRLPYRLLDRDGQLLSAQGRERALCPRDNCTIDMLPELLEAGVHALKVEGRMKAPDYVHSVVSVYRAQLDDVLDGREVPEEDARSRARQLKRSFNRDFTAEYQRGRSGDGMMSYERSNNRGQVVGEVVGSRPAPHPGHLHPDDRRLRAAMVSIRLAEPVGQGDLIELRHDDEWDRYLVVTAVEDAQAGSTIECRAARPMPEGAVARLIRSKAAFDAADAAVKREVPRKRPVHVRVRARLGEPFAVTLSCVDEPEVAAAAEGPIVEPARTKALTVDDLVEHVGRMGTTPFDAASFEVELDGGCGMGFSAVHRVRADACGALEERILAPYAERAGGLQALASFEVAARTAGTRSGADARSRDGARPGSGCGQGSDGVSRPEACICALVGSLDAVDAARVAGADRIYMTVDGLLDAGLSPDAAAGMGIVPVLDEVEREADHGRLDPWVQPGMPVAVGNVSELALAAERGAEAEVGSCLPVHNIACLEMLRDHGAHGFWLSPELSLPEIVRLGGCAVGMGEAAGPEAAATSPSPVGSDDSARPDAAGMGEAAGPDADVVPGAAAGPGAATGSVALGIEVLGRVRLMTSEHCILQVAGRCISDCARCELRQCGPMLENIDGKRLPVRTDAQGRSRLYSASPLDITPQTPELLDAGISRFMVDGTLLEPCELGRWVSRAVDALDAARHGRRPARCMEGATSGCLFKGVD